MVLGCLGNPPPPYPHQSQIVVFEKVLSTRRVTISMLLVILNQITLYHLAKAHPEKG